MSSFKAFVNDKGKIYTIMLTELALKHLNEQILQVTHSAHAEDVLAAIMDEEENCIETDENVIRAFKKDTVYLTVQFRSSF
ncbi:hypothetical protein RFI_18248, partial [Reticulomyxa filosa]